MISLALLIHNASHSSLIESFSFTCMYKTRSTCRGASILYISTVTGLPNNSCRCSGHHLQGPVVYHPHSSFCILYRTVCIGNRLMRLVEKTKSPRHASSLCWMIHKLQPLNLYSGWPHQRLNISVQGWRTATNQNRQEPTRSRKGLSPQVTVLKRGILCGKNSLM